MGKIRGAQLLIRALQAEGVEIIFGLPGSSVFSVFDACLSEGMRIVGCRHEGAVVHMAEGYARARGQPAVAVVNEGGGFVNSLPGLALALAESSPVLVISGIAASHELGKGAMQEIPQAEMGQPVSKWSALVPSLQRLPEFVATAFRRMRTGRLGPVHLCFPVDLLEGMADEDSLPIIPSRQLGPTAFPGADPRAIEATIDLLARAERPVIMAGSPAYWSRAGGVLQELIELTKVPLFAREQARGLVSDEHPHCFSSLPMGKAAEALARADVVLLLGLKMDSRLGFGAAFPSDAAIVQICPDPVEVGKNRAVTVGIAADVGVVTEQLLAVARGRPWPQHLEWLGALAPGREQQEELRSAAPGQAPLHPLAVARALETFVDDSTFQVMEFGNFTLWVMPYLRARRPGRWLLSDNLNMLGAGLPYALGAQVAFPEARVLLLSGDGAFGFYPMELDTAVRNSLPVVALVGNDAAWGIEQHFQRAMFGEGREVATSLQPVRYDLVADALGGHGEYVEQLEELEPALERAFAARKPACVNVAVQALGSPLTMAAARRFQQRVQALAERGGN